MLLNLSPCRLLGVSDVSANGAFLPFEVPTEEEPNGPERREAVDHKRPFKLTVHLKKFSLLSALVRQAHKLPILFALLDTLTDERANFVEDARA